MSWIFTIVPSSQGNTSLKNDVEITSAVSVCRVRSGISIAQVEELPPSIVISAMNAVAPPNDFPSLSNPTILFGEGPSTTSPSSSPEIILSVRYFSNEDKQKTKNDNALACKRDGG